MSYLQALKEEKGSGFNFDFTLRNKILEDKQVIKAPTFTKTGTTICAVSFKDGIVLGADTRATAGQIVADKNCDKIHYIAPNMYCCGAGTAADCEWVTKKMRYEMELMRLNTKRPTRITTVVTKLCDQLYQYQGQIGAALIIGCYDITGPQIASIAPHGSMSYLPYTSMGSGSLHCLSILEANYQDDLDEESAKQLVTAGIEAGILHDMGSGSNVDLCVIQKDKTEYLRNIKTDNFRIAPLFPYEFGIGNTPILQEVTYKVDNVVEKKSQSKSKMELE